MRKLLVLQHVPYEPLGLLDPHLRASGFRIRYVNFGRHPELEPDIRRYDGLVVLGGPMNVDQLDRYPHLAHEIELLRGALGREIPVLGICLGAQLLAAALGANVHPAAVHEIGWYPLEVSGNAAADPLLRHFGPGQPVLQWHAYTFTEPPGAVHLASTASCPNQAFRYGSRAYGFQFHLEADAALVQRWLAMPDTRRELEAFGGPCHAADVERETGVHLAAARALAGRVFAEFVALFGWRRPQRVLRTR
jgi:GMP synthase (glutamine-hydrolysing)